VDTCCRYEFPSAFNHGIMILMWTVDTCCRYEFPLPVEKRAGAKCSRSTRPFLNPLGLPNPMKAASSGIGDDKSCLTSCSRVSTSFFIVYYVLCPANSLSYIGHASPEQFIAISFESSTSDCQGHNLVPFHRIVRITVGMYVFLAL